MSEQHDLGKDWIETIFCPKHDHQFDGWELCRYCVEELNDEILDEAIIKMYEKNRDEITRILGIPLEYFKKKGNLNDQTK